MRVPRTTGKTTQHCRQHMSKLVTVTAVYSPCDELNAEVRTPDLVNKHNTNDNHSQKHNETSCGARKRSTRFAAAERASERTNKQTHTHTRTYKQTRERARKQASARMNARTRERRKELKDVFYAVVYDLRRNNLVVAATVRFVSIKSR